MLVSHCTSSGVRDWVWLGRLGREEKRMSIWSWEPRNGVPVSWSFFLKFLSDTQKSVLKPRLDCRQIWEKKLVKTASFSLKMVESPKIATWKSIEFSTPHCSVGYEMMFTEMIRIVSFVSCVMMLRWKMKMREKKGVKLAWKVQNVSMKNKNEIWTLWSIWTLFDSRIHCVHESSLRHPSDVPPHHWEKKQTYKNRHKPTSKWVKEFCQLNGPTVLCIILTYMIDRLN